MVARQGEAVVHLAVLEEAVYLEVAVHLVSVERLQEGVFQEVIFREEAALVLVLVVSRLAL